MIEIRFSAEDYGALYREIETFLDWSWGDKRLPPELDPRQRAATPHPEPSIKAEEPAKPKLDAKERMAKVRAAKGKKKAVEPTDLSVIPEGAKPAKMYQPPPSDPRSSDEAAIEHENAKIEAVEPDPFDEPEAIDPTHLAALRVKTTNELQAAYANGKHKQVLALLSKYGNGAKSFRELQIQDFIPLRKAIDDGALA